MDNLIIDKLDQARKELLDLTMRNKLIDTKRSSTRSSRLEIIEESAVEIYKSLIHEKRELTFLPKSERKKTQTEHRKNYMIDQVSEEDFNDQDRKAIEKTDDDTVITNQAVRSLQTSFDNESLHKKLLKLSREARTCEEEQGVNTLYLAIGFLKWFDAKTSNIERFAPLVLVPVSLERKSAQSKFRLAWREEEITTNLSLQKKMQGDFGIEIPDFPDSDDLLLSDYFSEISKSVAHKKEWEVLSNDMVLWFYSFSKFLMYRDLLPEQWSDEMAIEKQDLMKDMLGNAGFRTESPICGEKENIDHLLAPQELVHIMDADSSQTIAIEEVRQGRSLVIQGPPGTGKSQTIANIIATAVADGKKVLFVAEKMAALEVVKHRLDNIDLGEMCLELHSQKANKKEVHKNLEQALDLCAPQTEGIEKQAVELEKYREQLNQHSEEIHRLIEPANVTPYHVLGKLVQLASKQIPPAPFELDSVLKWSDTELQEHLNLVDDLDKHLEKVALPAKHPWRGVELQMVLPDDIQKINEYIPPLLSSITQLQNIATQFSEQFKIEEASTPLSLSRQAVLAQQLLKSPELDRNAIADSVWETHRKEIDRVIKSGESLQRCREEVGEFVTEAAWTTPLEETHRHLKAYGKSWFRFFNKKYREAQAVLRGVLVKSPPPFLADQLKIVETLIHGQSIQQQIISKEITRVGKQAFGTFWKKDRSNWQQLRGIANWEKESREKKLHPRFRNVLLQIENKNQLSKLIREVKEHLMPMLSQLENLFDQLKFNISRGFQVDKPKRILLSDLKMCLENWQENQEQLSIWNDYWIREQKLVKRGQHSLVSYLQTEGLQSKHLSHQSKQQYYNALIRDIFRQSPTLSQFSGDSHEQIIKHFQSLDKERIRLTRQEVAMAHFKGMPQSEMEFGEVAIIRREIAKKRGHLPLRKFLSKAGRAVQAIKPVFMMSPLSVAQFLEPEKIVFDLLLIDEASQVKPVDALGAIARTKQIVIVGDDRQLPPTNFFDKQLDDRDSDTNKDDFQAGDVESILGLCTAQGMSKRMLKWHYRSRHHSLIAVSNHEFYESKLKVIPSPEQQGNPELGLNFHHLPHGIYDRGGTRTNLIEAESIADAVIAHSQKNPSKTLGVGTFSVAQRDAILDQLEIKRKAHPELEPFFSRNKAEPFFVKNLENIQGDERDVIFISVGYARDKDKYLSMSFGPLNKDGGERRLNVLISRSRECCKVFSSITSDDIDLHRSDAFGVKSLKAFLKYAKTGDLDLGIVSGKEFDSDFELQVAKAIANHGYQVDSQIGVAGFFIDLAIVDPEQPGRYILGIECDGAQYHSSRSARDRDRIRQSVLEDRGWIIYRIWSTDWFQRPDEQLKKTIAAIKQAMLDQTIKKGHLESHPPVQEQSIKQTAITRDTAVEEPEGINGHPISTPYIEAAFHVETNHSPHEISSFHLGEILLDIIEIEGPIHQDEIVCRVASLWNYKRTGSRISKAVEISLNKVVHDRSVSKDNFFYTGIEQDIIPIRNRENVSSKGLRKPERIYPEEIQNALLQVIEIAFSISQEDAIREVARLLGFRSTSSKLSDVIRQNINQLFSNNLIDQKDERLSIR